jgi:hypothetical protein
MGTYTLLFFMMTAHMFLTVASQYEEEKRGKKRTLLDTLWILLVFMAWITSIVGMIIWN